MAECGVYIAIFSIYNQIKSKVDFEPKVGIVISSFSENYFDSFEKQGEVDLNLLEGFPRFNVSGHDGKLLFGRFAGVETFIFAVRLIEETSFCNEDEKNIARRSLGIPLDKKVILTTSAQWQLTYKKYQKAVLFVEKSERAFNNLLVALAKKYYVVMVGMEEKEECGINFRSSISPKCFDMYINSANLFLSRNVISTSFAKAVLKGVQGILLINSNEERGYKCKMYPVGWYDYVAPIEENNGYFQCFDQCEMLDSESCLAKINELLLGNVKNENLTLYLEQLKKLKTPNDIFSELIERR